MTIYLFSYPSSSQTEILAQKQFFEQVFCLYFSLINISNIYYYKKYIITKKIYKNTQTIIYGLSIYQYTI